jgi:hypothetical protein
MKLPLRFSGFLLIIIFSISSCQLFDKEEQIPSYVIIDSVALVPNYADCGTSSQQISDVWVYADDKLVGCFELPAHVPILAAGSVKLTFLPGIKVNGISATRATYPFYTSVEYQSYLSPDSALHIKPIFSFDQSMVVSFNEDFESAGVTFQKVALNSDTTIEATNLPGNVFVNTQDLTEVSNYSGLISLDTAHRSCKVETINSYALPKNGTYVFLEFNYKCTTPILVGTKADFGSTSVWSDLIVLNPTTVWKKTYINLTVAVSSQINAINYKVYFKGALRSGALEDKILLDNIKLVHARTSK